MAYYYGYRHDFRDFDDEFNATLRELQMPLSILQLDPADRAVLRIADERDAVQKKTFTKWANKHLQKHWKVAKSAQHISDLFDDLRDGSKLITLLEVLSQEALPPLAKGRLRFHKLQNVQVTLDFLKHKGIKLVNIRADEIVDGNPKLTLGLIWVIILHFQISDVVVPGQAPDLSARDSLLLWSRRTCEGYPGVNIRDFSTSWRDGRAFLALIHRNRPDLVNYKEVRQNTPRKNLELAFSVAEKELGVTKLLDPEDVDVPDPDEKSIITYVSSLYNVFPEVPSLEQSLQDNERQLRWEEYKELASKLVDWLQQQLAIMSERNFPATVVEMKTLLTETNRYQLEEVPPRLADKQKLEVLFHQLQTMSSSSSQFVVDQELHIDNVNHLVDRFTIAQQERDMAIQAELTRLEHVQRLAEKVHKDAKICDENLDDIKRRMAEDEHRLDVINPLEAKKACDAFAHALKLVEETIHSMMTDVQTLQEGRYHQVEQLKKRATNIHERWVHLKNHLEQNLLGKLAAKTFTTQENITLQKRPHAHADIRLPESGNEYSKMLQDCLNWIVARQREMEACDYGSDVACVEEVTQKHRQTHREILEFKAHVDRCIAAQSSLPPQEQEVYSEYLSKMEVAYSLLCNSSTRHLKSLESLQDFMRAATNEMAWLSEKENTEISRDWSSKDLKADEIEKYYKNLMSDLEMRELQFNAVQDKGESLVMERHPASKLIEAYMQAMQAQWSWLLQLTLCLETHLKHATAFYQFFEDAQHCEQWMTRQTELLNSYFEKPEVGLDDGEKLFREIQELKDNLDDIGDQVQKLVTVSKTILPLKQRREKLISRVPVRAICTYKQLNMSISKDEECMLYENSQTDKWRVANSSGQDGLVPAVCFIIPPPNREAEKYAERLRIQFEHLQTLWNTRQRHIRKKMVFATIKVVKTWDLEQFQSLGGAQREAIMRALNEDAENLMQDDGSPDPELNQLREEMKQCNEIYVQLSGQMQQETASIQTPDRATLGQVDQLHRSLDYLEQTLTERMMEPIPRDMERVERFVIQHKAFESDVQNYEPQVESVQVAAQQAQGNQATHVQSSVRMIVDKWNNLWGMSHLYVERLKSVEIALNGIEDVGNLVSDCETSLASQDNMSSEVDVLKQNQAELKKLTTTVKQQQVTVDTLGEDVAIVRKLVARTRPGVATHPDVEKMEGEVDGLNARWCNVADQAEERLSSVDAALEFLSFFHSGAQAEGQFVDETRQTLDAQPEVVDGIPPPQEVVEEANHIYASVNKHRPEIESVNSYGGKYIKEAGDHVTLIFNQTVANLKDENDFLQDTEGYLNKQQTISDERSRMMQQLREHQHLQSDIARHQESLRNTVLNAEKLLDDHIDELDDAQVQQLKTLKHKLEPRLQHVATELDSRLKRLELCSEELEKFYAELARLEAWLQTAESGVIPKTGVTLDKLKEQMEKHKGITKDVISHQADIRFINMAAQKFMDEAKQFQKLLLKHKKGDRSSKHIDTSECENVREKVRTTADRYTEVVNKCNAYGDKLEDTVGKRTRFLNAVAEMEDWIKHMDKKLDVLTREGVGTEAKELYQQLERVRKLNAEAIQQNKGLDEVKDAGKALMSNLSALGASDIQIEDVESTMSDLENQHGFITADITARSNVYQTAIVQSLSVREGIEGLTAWLQDTENKLRSLRPISLYKDVLKEQMNEIQVLQGDIEVQEDAIDSVNRKGKELMRTSDEHVAKAMDAKLGSLNKRFQDVVSKCESRARDLEDVASRLAVFQDAVDKFELWSNPTIDSLESRDTLQLDPTLFKQKVEQISDEKERQMIELEHIRELGKSLIENDKTIDVGSIKETLTNVEQNWYDVMTVLEERQKEADLREQQSSGYEMKRAEVSDWLGDFEGRLDTIQPVALDMAVVKQQIKEMQPLVQEYEKCGNAVDEVNDLGNAFDALQSGERALSPIRRVSKGQRFSSLRSPSRLMSPSPTRRSPGGGLNGSMSSESSGVSSRKSSVDNILSLDDLTETQCQLIDINQRYELVGDRLADRQGELERTNKCLEEHQEDLATVLAWVQKNKDALSGELPASESQAKQKLKEHKKFQEQLEGKEPLVEAIRQRADELAKHKVAVPGIRELQEDLKELDDKWNEAKAASEDRRHNLVTVIEDIKDFKDSQGQLQKWLAQKEKMIQALGPIATDPKMIENQLQQIKVLQEEMNSHLPQFEQFIQCGTSVLDKSEPDTNEAQSIAKHLEGVSGSWDKLEAALREREENLAKIQADSNDFHDAMQKLDDWIPRMNEKLSRQSSISSQPDVVQDQKAELKALEDEAREQEKLLSAAKKSYAKISDTVQSESAKQEMKNKLENLEKALKDTKRRIAGRKSDLEGALNESRQFQQSVGDLLSWAHSTMLAVDEAEPVSGDIEVLKEQTRMHEALQKEMAEKAADFKLLLERGKQIVDSSTPSPATSDLENKLDSMKAQWAALESKVAHRRRSLSESNENAKTFQASLDHMNTWLQFTEEKLVAMPPVAMERVKVVHQLKDTQSLQNEIQRKAADHETLNVQGKAFAESVSADKEAVKANIDKVNTRWSDLSDGVTDRIHALEDRSQKLHEYFDLCNDVTHALSKFEDKVASHNALGPAAKDTRYLHKVQALQEEVELVKPQLEYLRDLADNLTRSASPKKKKKKKKK